MFIDGTALPDKPFYNNLKKNYNEDDEEDEAEEIIQTLSPTEQMYSFFSEYILNAEECCLENEDPKRIDFFFVLAGYKRFSLNIETGRKDMNEYFSNQQ